MQFNKFLIRIPSRWFPMAPIRNSDGNGKQIINGPLLHATKIPTYTFIQAYTFISFQEIFPPILLFSPIFLLVFQKISHLYFYSESSSIRNSTELGHIFLQCLSVTYVFVNFLRCVIFL